MSVSRGRIVKDLRALGIEEGDHLGLGISLKKVGLVVTGTLLHTAMTSAKQLDESGLGVTVLHMPTIKPLDTAALDVLAAEHESIVTLEEHQVAGGLGSAVAEYLSSTQPKKIVRLGVQDKFGQSGTPEELLAHYGMDVSAVVETIKTL